MAYTLKDYQITDPYGDGILTHISGRNYETTQFTGGAQAGGGYDLTMVEAYIKKEGTWTTETITAYIYSDTGLNVPNVSLGTSDTVLANNLTTSFTYIQFPFSTPITIVNTTKYWIVLLISTVGANPPANRWTYSTSVSGLIKVSPDGTSWSDHSSQQGIFKTYATAGAFGTSSGSLKAFVEGSLRGSSGSGSGTFRPDGINIKRRKKRGE
jgi:hypothetical protein